MPREFARPSFTGVRFNKGDDALPIGESMRRVILLVHYPRALPALFLGASVSDFAAATFGVFGLCRSFLLWGGFLRRSLFRFRFGVIGLGGLGLRGLLWLRSFLRRTL